MSAVVRPTFFEGQIVAAVDLNEQVAYARHGLVMHERTEHLWGVAHGLTLEETPRPLDGPDVKDVSLLPGRAVDPLGRSLVLTDRIPLEPSRFSEQIPPTANPGDLYPVFVEAIVKELSDQRRPGACATGGTTRIEESVQIVFGRPGSEIAVLQTRSPGVDVAVDGPIQEARVLVGWVSWSTGKALFTGAAQQAAGRRVRQVGVVASEVVAGAGSLALRTRATGTRFAVTLNETATGCELRFGKQEADGPVSETMKIDEKGNLTISGTMTPAPLARVYAASGVSFDGLRLPLPAGIAQDDVDAGKVQLHVQVHPVVTGVQVKPIGNASVSAIPLPTVCEVDPADGLRVRCRIMWLSFAGVAELPAPCNYLVIASPKQE